MPVQIIQALLSYPGIHVNASNRAGETALGIAEKYFNEEIAGVLRQAGGSETGTKEEIEEIGETQIENVPRLLSRTPNKLMQAVSFLRQEVKLQLCRSRRTQLGVDKLKKKVAKMINNGLNKANNSNIVVATLIFSSAFAAIFQVPGQYTSSGGDGYSLGQAYIANGPAFSIFLLSDCFALFVSLAVVVAQTSLIVVDQKAMEWMVFVINKLMWACCISITVAFVSLAYVVIRQDNWWLAWCTVIMAAGILISTLGIMCYCVISHWVHRKKVKHSIEKAITGIGETYSRCATLVSDVLLKAELKKKMYAI